jgi:translation initiation factor IF-3
MMIPGGYRINEKIRVPQVRLVGDNIENPGIYSLRDALKIADTLESGSG